MEVKPMVSVLEDCWVPSESSQWKMGWDTEGGSKGKLDWEAWSEELESFTEWAALISLSAECVRTFSRSDELNSYQVGPDPTLRRAAAVVKIQYRGFISAQLCAHVMRTVHAHLLSLPVEARFDFAWCSCSGFNDSPLAWRMEPLNGAPDGSAKLPQESSSSEGEDEGGEGRGDDDEMSSDTFDRPETGPRARKRRQKKQKKRGTVSREQVGHQVKVPGASNCNGWQVLLFADRGGAEVPEYVSIENVGGCLRC
jgi:hypothetical protein